MRFFLAIVAAFLGVLAALFFVFILFVAILSAQDPTPSVAQRTVLVLDLDGPLPETQPIDPFQEIFTGRVVTLRDAVGALEKAAADDRIVGVWLRPSGVQASWATLAELRGALETYRASGKPLVASSGDFGYGEPAYYLATAADSLYGTPESMFELNGFHISAPFFGEMFERLGIEPVVVRAGDYKAAAENITERQFSPENREQYEVLLRAYDDRFRSTIAQARAVDRAAIDQIIAGGGIHSAHAALGAGLIDELRYEHDVTRLWRHHTGQDADEELRTVSLRDYARVTPSDAGVTMGNRRNRIAVLYATGVIMPGRSGGDGGAGDVLGSRTFVNNLQEALRDDRTRAIVIRIDSPGGSASASDAMWAAIRDASARVPVVVSMASVAASGGYYMAVPASAIVAEEGTITGSIGVISLLFDATEFLDERLGITVDTIQTGPTAGLFAALDPVTEAEVGVLQEMTERIYDTFVDRVAAGRNMSRERVLELGGGRIYTGRHALELGLVDHVGDLHRAVAVAAELAELEEDDFRLLILPRRRPLFERLSEALSMEAAVNSWVLRNMTPEERFLRRQAATLRQAAEMHGKVQMRMMETVEVR